MTGLPPEPVPRAPWPLQALLLASVLGPLLLLALASWQDYRHLDREAEQDVRKTVDILHEHAVKVLETVELVLARVDGQVADRSAFLQRRPSPRQRGWTVRRHHRRLAVAGIFC